MEKPSLKHRLVHRTATLMIVAGGLVISFPFWSAAYTSAQQNRLSSDYRKTGQAFVTTERANAAAISRLTSPERRVEYLAALFGRQLKTGDPVGRLQIPRLHIDRVVQQGAGGAGGLSPSSDTALLRKGPVHYGTTPLPGAGRPFAVAGHRTTYGAPFYHLNELHRGDTIVVDTPYARFRYSVDKVTVVLPGDTSVLADRGYDLVLTTCTPLYSASHRLIVWATLSGFDLK